MGLSAFICVNPRLEMVFDFFAILLKYRRPAGELVCST